MWMPILGLLGATAGLTLFIMWRENGPPSTWTAKTKTFVCSSCHKTVTEDAASHSGSQCSNCFDDHFSAASERADWESR